jgi:hypothetical protein
MTSETLKRVIETKIPPQIFLAMLRDGQKDGVILFLGEGAWALLVDEFQYPAATAGYTG